MLARTHDASTGSFVRHPQGHLGDTDEEDPRRSSNATSLLKQKGCRPRWVTALLTCETSRERMTGIEPAYSAWEADVLPLNYIRERLTEHTQHQLRGAARVWACC